MAACSASYCVVADSDGPLYSGMGLRLRFVAVCALVVLLFCFVLVCPFAFCVPVVYAPCDHLTGLCILTRQGGVSSEFACRRIPCQVLSIRKPVLPTSNIFCLGVTIPLTRVMLSLCCSDYILGVWVPHAWIPQMFEVWFWDFGCRLRVITLVVCPAFS